MRNGLLIGCHQGMTNEDLNFFCKIFSKFLNKLIKLKQNLEIY